LFARRFAHQRRRQHDFSELVQPLLLFLVQEFRITDDVDEKDVRDFKRDLLFHFRSHR